MSIAYEYAPLSKDTHTRVIELQPAKSTVEPLHCTVIEIEIAKDLDYSAISYVWGAPDFTEDLIVDHVYLLRITRNLRDALLRFRLKDEPRRLWIDAICINQSDDAEKSKQVTFMSSIYRTASSVLVWLGNFPDGVTSLKELKALSRTAYMRSNDESQFDNNVLRHLRTLSDLPWFGRRWVIQELVLSPEPILYCSSEDLSWIRIVSLVSHTEKMPQSFSKRHPGEYLSWIGFGSLESQKEKRTMQQLVQLWRYWVFGVKTEEIPGQSLLRLVIDFENHQCSDDRDMIFALTGLLSNEARLKSQGELTPQVDYSLSTETVYVQFAEAVWCGSDYDTYTLLWEEICARSCAGHGDSGFPWWVSDWRRPKLRVSFRRWEPSGYMLSRWDYFYDSRVDYMKCPEEDGAMPWIRSGLTMVVTEAWDPLPADAHPVDTARWLRTTCKGIIEQHSKKDGEHRTVESLQQFFIRSTFFCIEYTLPNDYCDGNGTLPTHIYARYPSNEERAVATLFGIIRRQDDFFSPEEVQMLSEVAYQLRNRRAFSWSTIGRPPSLSSSMTTRFGFGPDHLCHGDLILRGPSSDVQEYIDDYTHLELISIAARKLNGFTYRIVGDCYVCMDTPRWGSDEVECSNSWTLV